MDPSIIAALISTSATILVGLSAFAVYHKQVVDDKKAAANKLLLEIQHIERSVKLVKDAWHNENINNIEFDILRDDSWSRYSHLFSKDFDNDEKELLSNFFQNAKLLDESVKKSRESFNQDVAQIRVNKQRILASLVVETVNNPSDNENAVRLFSQKAELANKMYMSLQDQYLYTPMKYANDAKKYCDYISNISTTTVGIKLKRIIGKSLFDL